MSDHAELTVEVTASSLETSGDTNMLVEALRTSEAGVDVRLTTLGAPGTRTRAVTAVPAGDPSVVRFGRPNSLGQITFRGLSRERHRVTVLRESRAGRPAPVYPLPATGTQAATRTTTRSLRSADGRTAVELVTVGHVLWATAEVHRDPGPDEVFLLPFECAGDSDGSVRRLIIALGAADGRARGTVHVGDPAAQDRFDVREPAGPDRLHELAAVGSDPDWRTVVEESVAAAAYPADRAVWNRVLARIPAGGSFGALRAVVRDALARW